MIELVRPDARYFESWRAAMAEFEEAGDYPAGSGLIPDSMADEDVKGPVWRAGAICTREELARFAADMVARATVVPPGLVPDTKTWIIQDGEYVGCLSLRHELNDFLLEEGGHIGYSVRPSARRRGVATAALRRGLEQARALGLTRVLVTCDDDNSASAGTILKCGGVLEDVRAGKQRYWIEL